MNGNSPYLLIVKLFRQFLQDAQAPGANTFNLKVYRAGHATVMAREGASWAALQSAGEWRGEIVADSSEEEAVFYCTTGNVVITRVVLEGAVCRPRFVEAALGWSIGGCLAYVGP